MKITGTVSHSQLSFSRMKNTDEKIYTSDKDGVRTITLNRPEKKNAFDQSMFPMLATILEEASNDEDVKVLSDR